MTLVIALGFEPIRQKSGSHRRFFHPGVNAYLNLQPKGDGMAKDYQVRQVLEAIDTLALDFIEEG